MKLNFITKTLALWLFRQRTIWAFCLVVFCLPVFLQAQEIKRCGTDEHLQEMMEKDPELRKRMKDAEQQIRTFIQNRQIENDIITIPVVFHVLHNGDAVGTDENISDTYLEAQIEQLNDDFRRTNSDTGNTPAEFTDEAADTEIQFCLAKIDPDGNPTTGIDRVNISTLSGADYSDCWTKAYINSNIKPETVWDSDLYLNIWVLAKIEDDDDGPCEGGLLGYAQFPFVNSPSTDGVVVLYNTVGSIADPFPGGSPYNLGRTGTHEVGHWLELYHIWGDDSNQPDNCIGSDLVDDTPNQDVPTFGCPSHPQMSCGSNDMFQNYMDYSDDDCFNLFTQGQAERMHAAIALFRPEIINSPCECPNNRTLTDADPGTLTGESIFAAEVGIEASNTIAPGAIVDYHAGEYVRLLPNFNAQTGADFHAYIQSCLSGIPSSDLQETIAFRNNEDNTPTKVGSEGFHIAAFPNPFAEQVTIDLELDQPQQVHIEIFDSRGRLIQLLLEDSPLVRGTHQFVWETPDLPEGVYICLIRANEQVQPIKLMLSR